MQSAFPWKGRFVVVAAGFMLLLTVFAFRSFTAVYGPDIDDVWSSDAAPTAVATDSQEAQGADSQAHDPEPTHSVVLRLILAVTTVLILADLVIEVNRRLEHRFGDRP